MALLPVDQAAYATCRLVLEAGAALWQRWSESGKWPASKPQPSELMNILFDYISADSVVMSAEQMADDPDCQFPRKRSCFYLTGEVVFSPTSRAALRAALDLRTPPEVLKTFEVPGADDGDLEWWAVALTSGALIAIGGLPFAGATVARIAGYLLASWAAYKFVTPKTPGGKSLAAKYLGDVGKTLEQIAAGAGSLLKAGAVVLVGVLLWRAFR